MGGLYEPVMREKLIGSAKYTSPYLWQNQQQSNIVICHIDKCWWIADARDCTEDFYVVNNGDPSLPPVPGVGWVPCSVNDTDPEAWAVGVAPVPQVEWGQDAKVVQ